MPYISEQVVAAAATALGNQSTQGYLKNVYGGFNQIAQSNQKAATSAGQLADGTAQLSARCRPARLRRRQPGGSLDEVAAGADELQLGDGLGEQRTAQVASGATELSQGARKLHSGADEAGAQQPQARRTGRATSPAGPGRWQGCPRRRPDGASRLSTGTGSLADGLRDLGQQCSAAGGSVGFCAGTGPFARPGSGPAPSLPRAGACHGGSGTRQRAVAAAGAGALADGERDVARGAQRARQRERAAELERDEAGLRCPLRRLGREHRRTRPPARLRVAPSRRPPRSDVARFREREPELERQLGEQRGTVAEQWSGQGREGEPDLQHVPADRARRHRQPAGGPEAHDAVHRARKRLAAGAIVAVILWLCALAGALGVDISAALRNALTPVSSRRIAVVQALPAVGIAVVQAVAVRLALAVLPGTSIAATCLVRAGDPAGRGLLLADRLRPAAGVRRGGRRRVRAVPAPPGGGTRQRRTTGDGARRAPRDQRAAAADGLHQRHQPARLRWRRSVRGPARCSCSRSGPLAPSARPWCMVKRRRMVRSPARPPPGIRMVA